MDDKLLKLHKEVELLIDKRVRGVMVALYYESLDWNEFKKFRGAFYREFRLYKLKKDLKKLFVNATNPDDLIDVSEEAQNE